MHEWLAQGQWFGNATWAWVVIGACALLGYAIAHGAAWYLAAHLRKLGERTHRQGLQVAAGVVAATRGWLLFLIAVATGLDFLRFDARLAHALRQVTFILVGVQLALWAIALVVGWMNRAAQRDGRQPANAVMFGVLKWAIQFVIWVTLLLAVLANSGVQITAFLASLGIGGVAVALALQNVLGDLFASISIGLDKPFEVGHYIAFDDVEGNVVGVGVKSTRIRSQSGEELVIANSVLLKSLIHNYSRMRERRIVFTLRLPFDTPRTRIQDAIARVRGFIEAERPTRFDRGYLARFGDYGLELEFAYYVLDPAYNTFVAIQQRINLAVLDAFADLGVEFAQPTHVLRTPAAGSSAPS